MFGFKLGQTNYVIKVLKLEELLVCSYINKTGQNTWLHYLETFDIKGEGMSGLYENAEVFLNEFLKVVNVKLDERHGNAEPTTEPPKFKDSIEELQWRVANLLSLNGKEVLQE